jgi:hypothetical protein
MENPSVAHVPACALKVDPIAAYPVMTGGEVLTGAEKFGDVPDPAIV